MYLYSKHTHIHTYPENTGPLISFFQTEICKGREGRILIAHMGGLMLGVAEPKNRNSFAYNLVIEENELFSI